MTNDRRCDILNMKRFIQEDAMATMKDIAKVAGVSLGTVSNVFNGKEFVTEENRNKVLMAAKKIDYRPNEIARSFRTNKSKAIGLVIPDVSNPFYADLARGISDVAQTDNTMVFLCNTYRNETLERKYLQMFSDYRVGGIMWVKPLIPQAEIMGLEHDCAIVFAENDDGYGPQTYNSVCVNVFQGGLDAMHLLIKNGHRRIGFICGLANSRSGQDRFKAYKKGLEEIGFPYDARYVYQGDFKSTSGYQGAKSLLELPEPPTAIFAANDLMAIGAMRAITEKELSIPHDISIIGFDDIEMASLTTPKLTTVRQPFGKVGESCYQMFRQIKQMDSLRGKIPSILFDTELVIRDSVAQAIY